ncbi:MAG: GTP cyclohydrolase I FolE2 [Rhodobacteraceae bacterium]|nr:GTP cyclohydrolase I FolE2 [Paracoccaceae bacterium]
MRGIGLTVHSPKIESVQSTEDIKDSLNVLKKIQKLSSKLDQSTSDSNLSDILTEIQTLSSKSLKTTYPSNFIPNEDYLKTMPDIQNGSASLIRGSKQRIQHVGISNFRLPVSFKTKNLSSISLETSVTGSVSLEANKKGVNMSRIMRSFYKTSEETFSFDVITKAIALYKKDLDSFDARIQMKFSFPIKITSLRSKLEGYQYYDIALEVVDFDDIAKRIIHLDYVYSSTCPCSLELAEHARSSRNQLATPHSQRSVARISAEINPNFSTFWFEDLVELCREAVPTETQVMVKREDEQAFAELNGSNPIFVEDAVRSFAQKLSAEARINDYRIIASHQESLHSHDAISVLTEGKTFKQDSLDPNTFKSLFHIG